MGPERHKPPFVSRTPTPPTPPRTVINEARAAGASELGSTPRQIILHPLEQPQHKEQVVLLVEAGAGHESSGSITSSTLGWSHRLAVHTQPLLKQGGC